MNCEDFELILMEAARGGKDAEALAHVAICSRCALRSANQRALTAAFAVIATKPEDAPTEIERILLAAFAQRTKRRAVRGRAWLAVGGAIAAAIVLALSWSAPPRKVLLALPTLRNAPFHEQSPPAPQSAAVGLAAPSHKRLRPRAVRASAAVSEFYPIPYADPLTQIEHAELIRVKVDDRLNAELIVGQDGLARAIRFIQLSQSASQ